MDFQSSLYFFKFLTFSWSFLFFFSSSIFSYPIFWLASENNKLLLLWDDIELLSFRKYLIEWNFSTSSPWISLYFSASLPFYRLSLSKWLISELNYSIRLDKLLHSWLIILILSFCISSYSFKFDYYFYYSCFTI